jgi:hypothetical protein
LFSGKMTRFIDACGLFSFNSHTAAIAAGNNGIPVRMHGHEFGKASGMAPRAR